jgi:hypothetical protein
MVEVLDDLRDYLSFSLNTVQIMNFK